MLLHRSSNVFENSTNILNSTTTWYQQYDHVSLNCQLVLHIKVFGDIVERKDSYWNTLLEFNCVFSLNNFPGPINISALSLSFIQEFGQNLLELYITFVRENCLFETFYQDFLEILRKKETKIGQAVRFHDERLRDPKELGWTYVGHIGQEATTVT